MPGSNEYSMLSNQQESGGGGSSSSLSTSGDNGSNDSSSGLSFGSSFLETLGGIASVISNPLGSLLSSIGNIFLSNQRNEQAIEQWKRENEYNLPKNQIERLRQAGLNPALMYENGASGLVSAQSPELSMGNVRLNGIDPLTAAQIRNLDQQTQNLADLNARENELQPFNVQNVQANNRVLAQQVKNMTAQEQDIYKQWMFREAEISISKQMADEQCRLWNSQEGLNEQLKLKSAEEYRQLCSLYQLRRQGIILTNQEIQTRCKVNAATAANLAEQTEYISQYFDLANQQQANNNAQTQKSMEMQKFEQNLLEWQAYNQQSQTDYWDDYIKHPSRYRATSISAGVKGPAGIGASGSYTN